ncbi:MAG: UPF0175 family protein [Chloroflexota bacterium]
MGASQLVQVELPAEVVNEFGSAEAAAERLRQFAVMDLLRQHKISQGRAAELLDVSYPRLWDLMAEWDIPVSDLTEEELDHDLATLRALRAEPR